MKKSDIKVYIFIYLITIIMIISGPIWEYPLSNSIFVIVLVSIVVIAKIKYYNNPRSYIIYSFLWSIICILIFMGLLLLANSVDIVDKIMSYQIILF